jgi:hypothetical protein
VFATLQLRKRLGLRQVGLYRLLLEMVRTPTKCEIGGPTGGPKKSKGIHRWNHGELRKSTPNIRVNPNYRLEPIALHDEMALLSSLVNGALVEWRIGVTLAAPIGKRLVRQRTDEHRHLPYRAPSVLQSRFACGISQANTKEVRCN